ncbi:MAG: sigma-70 family RNA polymerase sigma factor [Planctomycetes bacterium]|nr:sigma-70 family RNA polymerase sigma factor [Planctomycetota bacterium]
MSDFTAIFDQTQEAVRLYIAARGIPLTEVDDIAQDVYVEFYKAQDRRPPEVEPIRWLKGMARNHCLRWYHKNAQPGAFLERLDEAAATVSAPLCDEHAGDDLLLALQSCLSRLPEQGRGLLERYYGDDQAFDRTTSGVRMAVMRMREALRLCILARVGKPHA